MNRRILAVSALCMLTLSCGKRLAPSDVSGTYTVVDAWKSNKELIGSGTLRYDLQIIADGDGVILMNLNKTLNGVKGKLQGDRIVVERQTIASASGNLYDVIS